MTSSVARIKTKVIFSYHTNSILFGSRSKKLFMFKFRRKDYKSEQGFQIGGDITIRGNKDFKSRLGLQTSAEQLLCHKTLLYYKYSFIPDGLLQEIYNQKVGFMLGNSFSFLIFCFLLFSSLALSSAWNKISQICRQNKR